jgi:hypothetical protein
LKFEPLHPILTHQPFDLLGLDFMGPMQETPSGNLYILHVIDYFTRFSHAWPTRTCTVEDVKSRLKEFFEYFIQPVAIYSDRGTHFNRELTAWLEPMGVEHIRTPAFSPSSTGMVEKRNHLLAERLRRLTFGHQDLWDQHLRESTRELNFHEVETLGYSPFQILFGMERRMPLACYHTEVLCAISTMMEEEKPYERKDVEEALAWRDETRDEVKTRHEDSALLRKERHDEKLRGKPRKFESRDLAMLLDKTDGKGKFDPRWRGPFIIVSEHHGAYRLQHPRHTTPYPGLYAADHLRLYHPRPERLRSADSVPVEIEGLAPTTLRARRRRRS